MKRIGILTIHNSPNYGATLQCYALYKYLSQQTDVQCEIIDLHRPYEKGYIHSKKFLPYRYNKPTRKERLKTFVKHILWDRVAVNGFSNEAKQKFDAFTSQIRLSKSYWSIDELYANPPIYDIYMTGSDQVWNPTQPYCLEPYFLTFVPKGKKRVSYASSVGVTELQENEKSDFKRWLSCYDIISVRERQAQKLLSSFVDRNDITQVPDPTFLLDVEYWKNLATKPSTKEPYLLLFTLQWSQSLVNYALELSKKSGLKLFVLTQIQPPCKDGSYVAVTDAGPKEFIGYIANAEMVLTDSFHCTVFSIIMGTKNFYAYISPDNKRGVRITDLLDTFGLECHLLTGLTKSYPELVKEKVDRNQVLFRLDKTKMQGRTFLDKCLG